MNIKTIIKIAKIGITVITVVPPVVEGVKVINELTKKAVGNRLDKSKHIINNIKKDFELRKEGVKTVKYQEV